MTPIKDDLDEKVKDVPDERVVLIPGSWLERWIKQTGGTWERLNSICANFEKKYPNAIKKMTSAIQNMPCWPDRVYLCKSSEDAKRLGKIFEKKRITHMYYPADMFDILVYGKSTSEWGD